MTKQATAEPKATRREWIGLGVIALPCMLYSMDLTVLNLAVPQLASDLKPTAAELLWIIDIYGFMVAGFLMTMGTLGDRIGRRKLLLIGAAAFGAASILAAFSTSAEMLIVTRAILGIAGATLAPSTLSLLTNMFRDPTERTFAISMWISSYSVGAIIGPLVGGLLIQYFWWGSVFLAGVPVMILLLVLGPSLLPEFRDPNAGRLDIISALLSLAAVLLFIYGMKNMAETGFGWEPIGYMLAGIAVAIAFLRRQAELADPLIDLKLFRSLSFNAALGINVLGIFFMFGSFIFMAQYFQLVAGLTPLEAGLWSVPSALVFTAVSFMTPMLVSRMRPAYLLAAGMLVSAFGFMLLSQMTTLVGVVGASLIFSAGFTPVIALTTGLIVGAVPPEKTGAASALSETAAELGGALGIAVLGSLGTFIYRSEMAGAIPAEVPAELARTARSTLVGAIDAATLLPSDTGRALLTLAREAFSYGFYAVAVLSAIGMLAAAIVTLTVLRNVQPAGEGAH
jgi:MFS transporter, DHA2 family, multidrug resistance protein